MKFPCAFCGKEANRPSGEVNRARRLGAPLYCNRKCSGLGRRKHKPQAQKISEKREYDIQYRTKNREMLIQKHADYHRRSYDPNKAAAVRKTRMSYHVEYCRQPEYKAWKREYDRQFRAREFGEYAECHLLLLDIDNEVNSRMSDYDVRIANGTMGKRQQRKREHAKLISGRP